MPCKTLAFCNIYVAKARSFVEPSEFKIVHDLRLDETHSGTEIGHFHSFDKQEHHCQRDQK